MSWWWPFGSSKSEDTDVLTRHDRKVCWEARDAYYACLDGLNVIRAGTEGDACKAQVRLYEKSCAQSWIKYFNERRRLSFAQKDMLAQAEMQNATARKKVRKSHYLQILAQVL
ncbi:hypothetical protein MKEN_00709500 [Mycena kentingensis (nom. inval.)]|nr:hypothetical protein MKEN_00709500 [Mycena kentingensis (nom. inval.)]